MEKNNRVINTRELKFRVWDLVYNKMFSPEHVNGWQVDWFKQECYRVMQFTGLLDKEGKEIYEGDIIRYKFDDMPFDDEKEYTDVVTFQDGCFNAGTAPLYVSAEYSRVIGNVFSSPELLKQ